MATILPTFVEDNHPTFNSLMVGILLAAYQIAAIITAPLAGSFVGKIGRKNAIVTAIAAMTLATAIFAAAGLLEDDNMFYVISFGARLL